MKKITIKSKKFESIQQAEWRYFIDAMLHNKYPVNDVVSAMTDAENIKAAKAMLRQRQPTSKDLAKIAYLNSAKYDTQMTKLANSMSNHDGFLDMTA